MPLGFHKPHVPKDECKSLNTTLREKDIIKRFYCLSSTRREAEKSIIDFLINEKLITINDIGDKTVYAFWAYDSRSKDDK